MIRAAAFSLVLLASVPAAPGLAQERIDPDLFCQKAGKNQAIYERMVAGTTARAGATPDAVACTWTFNHLGEADVLVTLDSKLLKSPILARQTILMARLPENHRGKTVEPLPRMGDDGLSRATVENGAVKLFEIEAVQGRRHFRLTVRRRDGSAIGYRISSASINFLGSGIAAVRRL